jgi:hypothetical protein
MLRQRLEQIGETVQELEMAAEARYQDGLALRIAGRNGGSIYLLGYVAEIRLKLAYLRLTKAAPGDLAIPRLQSARRRGERLVQASAPHRKYGTPDNLHSLNLWRVLVLDERRARNLSESVSADINRCVNRLCGAWWIQMRYRRDDANAEEAGHVLEDVSWLRHNYFSLWT